jgi:hypothetical protein
LAIETFTYSWISKTVFFFDFSAKRCIFAIFNVKATREQSETKRKNLLHYCEFKPGEQSNSCLGMHWWHTWEEKGHVFVSLPLRNAHSLSPWWRDKELLMKQKLFNSHTARFHPCIL